MTPSTSEKSRESDRLPVAPDSERPSSRPAPSRLRAWFTYEGWRVTPADDDFVLA